MIDMKKLDSNDVGRWVWFKSQVRDWEKGRIKGWSVDGDMVFVVYKCNGKRPEFNNYTAAATAPADLDFIKHADYCRAELGFVCACISPTMKMKEESFL
jgi:hypothetical protein